MKLPNGQNAQIDASKLAGYLLSETHPVGRAKARFFRSVGFSLGNVDDLAVELAMIAKTQEVVQTLSTEHGVKYVVDGQPRSSTGRQVTLRTIWIIEGREGNPRFVTAYPA